MLIHMSRRAGRAGHSAVDNKMLQTWFVYFHLLYVRHFCCRSITIIKLLQARSLETDTSRFFNQALAGLEVCRRWRVPLSSLRLCCAKQRGSRTRRPPCWEPPTPGPPTFTYSPHLPLPPGRISSGFTTVIKKAQLFKQLEGTQWGLVGGMHQHIYFLEIKLHAHQHSTKEAEHKPNVRDKTVEIKRGTLKFCCEFWFEFYECKLLVSLYVFLITLFNRAICQTLIAYLFIHQMF